MGRLAHRTHLAVRAVAVLCFGHAAAAQTEDSLVATDDGGTRVALAAPARRIVSLSPATTELLFALGLGGALVGRTTWCDYPPEARAVPNVGDGLDPDLETVLGRAPDLVVLYPTERDERAAAQLRAMGVAAVVVRQDRLEELARAAALLGRFGGRARAGDSLARALTAVLAHPLAPTGVRVVLVVWDMPPTVIGGASYLDELVRLAGGTNVFGDLRAASSVVALETIAARDPQVVLALGDSLERVPPFATRPEWQVVRAVREHRVIVLAGSLFNRPTPRAAAAVAALHRLLAP